MSILDQITSPVLLLDETRCKSNIAKMAKKADKYGLKLAPHFKTPQSRIIGKWVQDHHINEITVSSVRMATYLAEPGWDTIHIAFPINNREVDAINELLVRQALSIQIVNTESVRYLIDRLNGNIGFFIEIDAGYGRTGIPYTDHNTIDEILDLTVKSDKLHFRGFYIHPGHTYYADIHAIYDETRIAMQTLYDRYRGHHTDLELRCGDTPGCSIIEDFGVINQLGPGNFIFFDLMQYYIGSCTVEDVAVALAAPVVDIDKKKNRILVHGGGVHLSKDYLTYSDGTISYGEVVILNSNGWTIPKERAQVEKLSQEHGIIRANEELMEVIHTGDLLGILPVHSCMTADCMKGYLSTSGQWIDHAEATLGARS